MVRKKAKKAAKARKAPQKATAGSKPKSTEKPVKTTKPSLFEHRKHCTVCNHPYKKQIEQRYFNGYSANMVAKEFDIPRRSLDQHVIVFELADKRDFSTLSVCQKIIRTSKIYDGEDKPSSDMLVGKALELQSKIAGELIDKKDINLKGTIQVLDMREHLAKKMANGHKAMRKPPPTEAEIDEAVAAVVSEDIDD